MKGFVIAIFMPVGSSKVERINILLTVAAVRHTPWQNWGEGDITFGR